MLRDSHMLRHVSIALLAALVTMGLQALDTAAIGIVQGHARHEKVKDRPPLGYHEWYEYKVFLTPDGAGSNSSVRAGALPNQPITGDGRYEFRVNPGTYSILATQPRFYGRTKVVPNVNVQDFQVTDINALTPGDYFCTFSQGYGEWGESPWDFATEFYQTFVATGTSINRISAKLASGVPSGGGGLRISVHQSNGGAINTWPQVGPARVAGGDGQSDNWVGFRSGDVPTTPGQTYAVRFVSEFNALSFGFYVRRDFGSGYAQGAAYKGTQEQPYDLYATVQSDNDGTVMPYAITSGTVGSAGTWSGTAGQTFRATGTSLAAVSVWAAGGGSRCWNWRAGFRVYQGDWNGPQIGPTKVCGGAAFEGACVGLGAVSYNPGEIPLVAGQTYYIEIDAWDYDPDRGFNVGMLDGPPYNFGHAYISRNIQVGQGLAMEILEYSGGVAPPPTNTPPPVATNTPTRTSTHTPTNTPAPPTATPTPFNDADGDGIPDALEGWPPATGQSNRYIKDSDYDGLHDGIEDANRNGQRDAGETDTRNPDSDGDGFDDGIEVLILNSNPLNANSPGTALGPDNDGDGLPAFLDPNDNNPDVDGDRFEDGFEAAIKGMGAVTNPNIYPSMGDISGDDAVSNLDALIIQSVFLGVSSPTDWAVQEGDINRDGVITNLDALMVQGYFLGVIQLLPF